MPPLLSGEVVQVDSKFQGETLACILVLNLKRSNRGSGRLSN